MTIRVVRTEEAVGKRLAYDTTLVTKEKAQVLLSRGKIIEEEDVERLKSSGVYYVYVEEEGESQDLCYEWEISALICQRVIDSETLECRPARQGAALIYSRIPGVIEVNRDVMRAVNLSGLAMLITRRSGSAVGQGELVGVVDALPLYTERRALDDLLGKLSTGVVLKRFIIRRIGLVITGTEVYEGRKRDQYEEVIRSKAERYGWEIADKAIVPDDADRIREAIVSMLSRADAVIVTGGMSVDATDRTPGAIRSLGAEVLSYGLPMKPTTMSMIAYLNGKIIFGISAGGIHYRELNSIDVYLTRLLAGWRPTREEIAEMGDGGLMPNFNPESKLH